MTKIISFDITGQFASFRDPSVTSNQTVYYIPSKTAVVGILGAMTGITRTNKLGELYSKEYKKFFAEIQIGVQLLNNPKKITYFTNYRSLKEAKTKPVKKEVLEKPMYRIYVKSSTSILDSIERVILNNTYHFSPYLGHAYCPATVTNLKKYEAEKMDVIDDEETECVVLDEAENYNENFKLSLQIKFDEGSAMIERHLHHFIKEGQLEKRVLKHWIPIESSPCKIEQLEKNTLSEFYKIDQKVYCIY